MSGMKKYVSTGLLALLTTAYLTSSCSRDDFSGSIIEAKKQAFSDNFKAAYGNINPLQDWGFGSATTRAFTRSMSNPYVNDITNPASYCAEVLAKSVEINSTNANNTNAAAWYNLPEWTNDYPKNQWIRDNYVINFKISSMWTGTIARAGNGSTEIGETVFENGEGIVWDYNANRGYRAIAVPTTIYIDNGGKWTLGSSDYQTAGEGTGNKTDCVIIVGNGGELEVNGTLNMANCARLIVLPGGSVTGTGTLNVNNGNADGEENYNGGTISVATFNNNFGKFYNHGKFLVNEYQGGAKESNFYNHALVSIDHFGGSTANARIFNACQFYVAHDARIRNYEGVANSSLIVDGQLMFSSSADGTSTPTYVGLGARALVQAGSLYNNGTSWCGPTSGYAVLSIGQFDFLNWEQNHPELGGYFANNIYVQADTWTNTPDGNGMAGENAEAKFANVKNAAGNGGVVVVNKGTYEVIPADPDYVKGDVSTGGTVGCTPGFSIDQDVPEDNTTETRVVLKECGRIFCEDLGNVSNRDMDYNDAVFDAWIYVKQTLVNGVVTSESHYRTYIQLLAAGGTIPVDVAGEGEIHKKFGVGQTTMVNTYIPNINEMRADLCVDKTTLPAEYEIRNGLDYYYARDVDGDGIGDICLKNIPIFVEQGTEATELEAIQGDAPQKYCATLGTKWAGERVQIDWAYTAFMSWVNKIENPWESGVPRYLYSDSGLKRSDGTAYNPQTAHGETMEYDPNDDPSTTSGSTSGTGGSTGGSTTGGTSFNNVTGTVVYQTQTQLTSGSGINIDVDEFGNAMAADIYVYGTGDGSVYVNGAPAEDVSSTSAAPIYNFTRGFGFTRSVETPVVKKCTLGPKQFHGQPIGITGNNFTVYKVSYTATQPSVSQPSGTVVFSNTTGTELDKQWNRKATISADKLTGITNGTIIRVAGVGYADNTDAATNTSWRVELEAGSTEIGSQGYATDSRTGAVTLEFELSSEQATALLNSQLVIQGVNFILKYVTIQNPTANPTEPTFDVSTYTWAGTQEFNASWSGDVKLLKNDYSTAFDGLGAGTVIHVYGYGNNDNSWSVKIQRVEQYNWQDLYNYQERKVTGTTKLQSEHVTFTLTEDEAKALKKSLGLVVYGQYFVAKYIYIDNTNATPIVEPTAPTPPTTGTLIWSSSSYTGQTPVSSDELSGLTEDTEATLYLVATHDYNWWEVQVWDNNNEFKITARSDNSYASCGHWAYEDINTACGGYVGITLTAAQVNAIKRNGMKVDFYGLNVSSVILRQ